MTLELTFKLYENLFFRKKKSRYERREKNQKIGRETEGENRKRKREKEKNETRRETENR